MTYDYDRRTATVQPPPGKPPWPGAGPRIGGRLAGPMPDGFVVVKAERPFDEVEVGMEYTSRDARHGSVKYLPTTRGGYKRWMDLDDVMVAARKGAIQPYGEYGKR